MKELKVIAINKIIANPYQPRNYFDEQSIEELAKSIKENGLIQPISVRKKGNLFEIVVGERRLRALQKIGYETIEVYVLDDSETGSMNKALIENIQREDLSAIEEAKAYLKIMQYQNITQQQLATMIGKSQPSVANKIRLLNLNNNIQNAIESKIISERHARAMLSLEQNKQDEVLNEIVKDNLNVLQTETRIKRMQEEKKYKHRSKGYARNVQVALNTIKKATQMVEKTGIPIHYEEIEEADHIRIHLRIKK